MQTFRSFLLAFGCVLQASGADVSLPVQSAAPGSSVYVPLTFRAQSDAVSGIQFDLQYDASVLSVTAIAGDAARASAKTLHQQDLPSGARRFLLIGPNRNSLSDGILVGLIVNLKQAASAPAYDLAISDVIGVNPEGYLHLTASSGGSVRVEGTAAERMPLLLSGVLNAASLLPGPVAPGEIVTLIGSGIGPESPVQPLDSASRAALAGTAVLFDDSPAPLLYASANQINAIVPYRVAGRDSVLIRIRHEEETVASVTAPVALTSPAIFTTGASGAGQAAILNEDATPNQPDNPAAAGSIISIFATGAGQTDPPGTDGLLATSPPAIPLERVSVQIGGVDADVTYAGSAPGLVAGVLQVNCRVPAGLSSSYGVPITLKIGQSRSPDGVSLSVR